MTPQDKARELAALYTSVANGRELQFNYAVQEPDDWRDPGCHCPHLGSNLSRWRIKPEPRTVYLAYKSGNRALFIPEEQAEEYRANGCTVSKWTEVLE